MNQSLVYNKSTMNEFKNADGWMTNSLTPFIDQQTLSAQDVFNIANKCRTNYNPVFANENQFLPTNTQVGGDANATIVKVESISLPSITSSSSITPTTTNTTTPNTITSLNPTQKAYLEDGLLIGIAVFVFFKILA